MMSAIVASGTPCLNSSVARIAPTNILSQNGSSHAPVPAVARPRLRATAPSSTSVAAASAITPSARKARVVVGPSVTQNNPPSGSRDRLSRLGRLSRELGPAPDIARRAGYHRINYP